MSALTKVLSSAFGLNALKKFISIISGVVFLILMTRYLGPELRGEYAYVLNWVNILATVFNLGISLVLANYKRCKTGYDINDFYSLSVGQFILYTVLSMIAGFATQSVLVVLTGILAAVAILHLQLLNVSLILNLRFHSFSVIASSVVNVGAIVIVYFVSNVNIYWIFSTVLLKEIVAIVFIVRLIRLRLVKPNRKWVLILRAGALPMIATGLIALNYKVDVLMLESLNVSMLAIGLYATGVALAEYSWVVTDVFKEFMLFKNADEENTGLMNKSLRVAFNLIVAVALVFAILGEWLLLVMFGESFVDSYRITLIALFSVPFMVFVKIIGTLFIVEALWGTYILILTVTVLLNVSFNWMFIPKYGIEAAALGSLVSYGFCGIACLVWYMRRHQVSIREVLFISRADVATVTRRFRRQR